MKKTIAIFLLMGISGAISAQTPQNDRMKAKHGKRKTDKLDVRKEKPQFTGEVQAFKKFMDENKVCADLESVTFFDNSIEVDDHNVPVSGKQFYFPLKFFIMSGENKNEKPLIDIDLNSIIYYSRFLYAMKEPLLFNKKSKKEIYRFTWLRTFHHPVTIRIEKDGETCLLYWKLSDGEGGYDPGKVITDKSKPVDIKIWQELKSMLQKMDFWHMNRIPQGITVDGSKWILEGAEPEQYRVVDLSSPEANDFYYTCLFLLNQTDLGINKEEIY